MYVEAGRQMMMPPSLSRSALTRDSGRILLVANRLPLTAQVDGPRVRLNPSGGGLATGLRAMQHDWRSLWIGWSGVPEATEPGTRREIGRRLRDAGAVEVPLSAQEVAGFYQRYSNAVLWPLLHDLNAEGRDEDWEMYRSVNERYADAVARELSPGDQVWVHDFHLMLVPAMLRARCPRARIGFFLHTPFPEKAAFTSHGRSAQLLQGMLGADVIGFHTRDYARNFGAAVSATLPHPVCPDAVHVSGRRIDIVAHGMGIDAKAFSACARTPVVADRATAIRGDGPLFVGVDRLDYTKGIPERLLAFERFLEHEPEYIGRARLLQLAVPSRENVPGYSAIRATVETAVRRINARFGTAEWTPVDYHYGSVDMTTLVAMYRAADAMLVTPLRDGMNLVAKEFVASRVDGDGVLVLSTHAGAATELRAALRVDPADIDALARTYSTALRMLPAERRVRMRRLRTVVAGNDVHAWAGRFLDNLGSSDVRLQA